MQTLFEASNHIKQEIERTRQHLINLEQALEGLKPLVTIDVATTTLTYTVSSQVQPVDDLSVVNADEQAKKKTKPKLTAKPKAEKTKAVKAKAGEAKVVAPVLAVEPSKLPATGAELWLKCIGRKKVTVAQIVDAALKRLKLEESARDVIATRAKAWTYSAAKKGDLIEAGMRDGSKLYQLSAVKDESPVVNGQAADPVAAVEAAKAVEVAPVAEAGKAD